MPPQEFHVKLEYEEAGHAFGRFAYYTALLRDMAKVSVFDWNLEIEAFQFEPQSNVRMIFASSAAPPRYQTKSILWTMVYIFHSFNLQGNWAEASWMTEMKPEGRPSYALGVGQLELSVGSTDQIQDSYTVGSNSSSSTKMSVERRSDPLSSDLTSRSLSVSGISNSTANIAPTTGNNNNDNNANNNSSNNDIQVRRGISVRLNYKLNARSYDAQQFYLSIVYGYLRAATQDSQSDAQPLALYNSNQDFTAVIGAAHMGSMSDFKWYMAYDALWKVALTMLNDRSGGYFAECEARIRNDGINVGRFALVHGQIQVGTEMEVLDKLFEGVADDDDDDHDGMDGVSEIGSGGGGGGVVNGVHINGSATSNSNYQVGGVATS